MAAVVERRSVCHSILCFLPIVVFFLINGAAGATGDSSLSSNKEKNFSFPEGIHPAKLCIRRDPAMNPFHEIRYGQDVVWQIPASPKAVLWLAHGKDKEPLSFFDPAPNCPDCYGLPEDREAVLAALKRGYAVIMVKSVGTYWFPWNVEEWPPAPSRDRTIVTSVIREWTKEHNLEHLPLAAFGFSSGGNFSTLLTLDFDIKSMVSMCTPGEFLVLERANPLTYPPTLFVPMPMDRGPIGFYTLTLNAIGILRSKGVLVDEVDVWPKPIHPFSLAERIPCLERKASELIYAALKADGWLDDDDYVILNPRENDWKTVLWKHNFYPLPYCEHLNDFCFVNDILEELTVAYGEHSFTSEPNKAIFDWLDSTVFPGHSEPAGLAVSR